MDKPVAWMTINKYGEEDDISYENPAGHLLEGWTYKPLYTTPQKKPWVGLTDDAEIFALSNTMPYANRFEFARAIEQLLKEKNS